MEKEQNMQIKPQNQLCFLSLIGKIICQALEWLKTNTHKKTINDSVFSLSELQRLQF